MKKLSLMFFLFLSVSLSTFANQDLNVGLGLKGFQINNPNRNWIDNGTNANPPAIDLSINNLSQENSSWNWIAVVQQILYKAKTDAYTPQQCELVSITSRQDASYCCQDNSFCPLTGGLKEIQALFKQLSGNTAYYSRPTAALDMYRTLASGQAIILAVKNTSKINHLVVISGMAWVPSPMIVQPVIYVNDPTGYFNPDQGIAFADLAKYWSSALVVN